MESVSLRLGTGSPRRGTGLCGGTASSGRMLSPFSALFTLGPVCAQPDPPGAALMLCLRTSAPPTQCALPGTGLHSTPQACLGPIAGRTVQGLAGHWPVPSTGCVPRRCSAPHESEGSRPVLCREPQGGSGGTCRRGWGSCLEEEGLELHLGRGRSIVVGRARERCGQEEAQTAGDGAGPGGERPHREERHLALPAPVQSGGGHEPRLKNIQA